MMFRLKLLLLVFVGFLSFDAFSLTPLQTDEVTLQGVVSDADNELAIGAEITLKNMSSGTEYQVATGLDGSYTIKIKEIGTYTIDVYYSGFQPISEELTFTNEDFSKTITKNFVLEYSSELLSTVLIVSSTKGTDAGARRLERESSNVLNIISAKQIQLSPDITVANVIQRVSGLSIERSSSGDPQYAVIRGMDKRYNNTLVNGIKIPSPDNENRYVPLDIFPAVFLERLDVYKSLTADMEADAIGGTINMAMKDAPVRKFIEADVQMGVNNMNFDRGFDTYDRSKLNKKSPSELFGPDYRAVPADFPVENMIDERKTPMPDVLANLSLGNRYFNQKLGVMLGGSFQNSYRPVTNYFYDPAVNHHEGNPLIMSELIERETSSQFQRIAFHGKLDYKLSENQSLDLYFGKYMLNEFRVRNQKRRETFVIDNNYAVYPITRFSNIFQDITTADLGGTHRLFNYFDMDWNAVYSVAKNDLPDDGVFSRAGQYNVDTDEVTNEIVYFQGTRNSRAWERNTDTDVSLYLNFKFNPNIVNEDTQFQFGGVARSKVRDNYYNYYNYAQIFGQFRGEDWNNFGEVDFIGMANPLGSGDGSNLVYDAEEQIIAAYFNSKWRVGRLEFHAGVRMENTVQNYEISALAASSNDVEIAKKQQYTDLFPSAGFKYALNDQSYLKGSYFKAISRPGFYEIVPTVRSNGGGDSFYSERGNSDLRPSYGHSMDLRYEHFPSSIDQFLVGVFYKKIVDPIEYGFPQVQGTDERPVTNRILPQNFDDATNFGIEVDYTKYFNKFGIRLNYNYTHSRITTDKIVINQDQTRSLVSQTRPLQGQSDHVGNLSLLYKDLNNKLDAQIVMNYTGERIAFVSPYEGADHYMKPMTQLDFSIEKGLGHHFVVFAKVNNILNTPYQLYVKKPLAYPEDPYPHQTDPHNVAYVRKDIFGTSFRLGARYNF